MAIWLGLAHAVFSQNPLTFLSFLLFRLLTNVSGDECEEIMMASPRDSGGGGGVGMPKEVLTILLQFVAVGIGG